MRLGEPFPGELTNMANWFYWAGGGGVSFPSRESSCLENNPRNQSDAFYAFYAFYDLGSAVTDCDYCHILLIERISDVQLC